MSADFPSALSYLASLDQPLSRRYVSVVFQTRSLFTSAVGERRHYPC